MGAFSQQVAASRKPAAVVRLSPSAFADEWPDRPQNGVAVGLSLLSDRALETCVAEAEKADDREVAMLRWAVGLALCDVNDASKPYFEMQQDNLQHALRPDAIRHLYDELERATIEASPVRKPADDDDLIELARLLASGVIEHLSAPQALRLRKLAAFMADELSVVESVIGGEEDE